MANISPKDSILTTIKKMRGIAESDTSFDTDIAWDINSVLLTLCNLGIGPSVPYTITGANETWVDFLGSQQSIMQAVVAYIDANVHILFDPPSSSFVLESLNNTISKLEFEMNVYVDDGSGGD